MKILLTGASGAIGRELLRQMPGIVPVSVRWNNFFSLRQNLKDADFLIHAGAKVHGEVLSDLIMDNVFTTSNLLECIQELNPNTRVISISSMSILNPAGKIKAADKMSNYSLSKLMAEQLVIRNPNARSVRFATIFYRDPTRDGLSKIIYNAKTTGEVFIRPCSRNFIPIEIVAREILNLCHPAVFDAASPTLNKGYLYPTNLYAVAAHLENKYGVKILYGEPDLSEVFVAFDGGRTNNYPNIFEEIDKYYVSI